MNRLVISQKVFLRSFKSFPVNNNVVLSSFSTEASSNIEKQVMEVFKGTALLDRTLNTKNILRENILPKYQLHESDTGSTAVQVASLTEKINNLSRHFLQHKKDKSSHRGFQMLLSKRKSLLNYLNRTDIDRYNKVVIDLGLAKRGSAEAKAIKAEQKRQAEVNSRK